MNDLQSQHSPRAKRLADVDRKRVLVIDDDLPLRGMLAAALRQHGFQVLLAGDGAEGQRALTIHNPDVVLLDLAMPDVNGWISCSASGRRGTSAGSRSSSSRPTFTSIRRQSCRWG
ncbi:MAG TPA: response regulator [Thermoanaerobaculia bacterium]